MTRFAYDEVPYDTEANAEAHPRALATLARLFGIETVPPSRARVLEIGCGNGDHLIACAAYMPEARFVGFDLAEGAIAAGRRIAPANVELAVRDIRDGAPEGTFDFVIAHGIYSWVPEPIRAEVLRTMRAALGPNGIGFLSVNARPGWELTRALREIALDAAAAHAEPAEKVAAALRTIAALGEADRDDEGFAGALSAHARSWLAHVRQTLPPEAPFSRYVFHDLLAECNDAFSTEELAERLAAAGLAIVCETPLRTGRAPGIAGLAAAMAEHGTPFLQVLVRRDDRASLEGPDPSAFAAMHAWSPRRRPGFVPATEDDLAAGAAAEIEIVVDPPVLPDVIVPLMRERAAAAVERGAPSAVLTSALHRSFTVPWRELVVVRDLDGARTDEEIARRVREAVRTASPRSLVGPLDAATERGVLEHVASVVDRFERYGFFRREGR